MTSRSPVQVWSNHLCWCIRETPRASNRCWRAICRTCGNFLAYHSETAEAAEAVGEALILDGHPCRPDRQGGNRLDPLAERDGADAPWLIQALRRLP